MKWAIFLSICSGISSVCSGTYSDIETYPDYYSCIKSGSSKVVEIVDNIDRKQFNEDKIIVRFYCQEINEDQTNKSTIPSYKVKKKI